MPPTDERSSDPVPAPAVPVRRPPPPFVAVRVQVVTPLGPHLTRVTLAGPGLTTFGPTEPAASVRLLVPGSDQIDQIDQTDQTDLELPVWNGNEWLRSDGSRPIIRTFTPLHVDPVAGSVDLDVVIHEGGAVSDWLTTARAGDPAAVSGPGRGYTIDPDAPSFLVAGDESAIPAIGQLLEAIPHHIPVRVLIEVAAPDARVALPVHPGAEIVWCDLLPADAPGNALLSEVQRLVIPADARIWVAGEAAGVQRIRRHLFEERGVSRPRTSVRGYWKHGRVGDDGAA